MASLRIAIFVFGVIGCMGCRPDTASPPPAQSATVTAAPAPETPAPIPSFAVYALSRGKGVPAEAREALRRVAELAEEQQRRGVKVKITTTRMGIEGETRVCVAYEDPNEGARAYDRAKNIVKNVDLVNLTIESCVEEKES
ncbi:MAG TPA: hypothetical protein VEK79_21075 [Thermoanaerobaculia bacterium]|nr:hypothetical protein [Thermoanaerobaculia bacterium]